MKHFGIYYLELKLEVDDNVNQNSQKSPIKK